MTFMCRAVRKVSWNYVIRDDEWYFVDEPGEARQGCLDLSASAFALFIERVL